MKNTEQELKLALTEREFGLLSGLSVEKPQLQTNFYFAAAAPNGEASQYVSEICAETMVRIRQKGEKFRLCYKRRLHNLGGVSVCDERECELTGDDALSMLKRGIEPCEINAMLQTDFAGTLFCLGSSETFRKTFFWKKWRLELDENFFFGKRDFELECECDSAESLEELKQILAKECGLQLRFSEPKFQRFLEARRTAIDADKK